MIADNGANYARLYYGVPRSGRILALVNQRLSPAEQLAQLVSAEPAWLTFTSGSTGTTGTPKNVVLVDALPLTSNGKVATEAVRRYARARLG